MTIFNKLFRANTTAEEVVELLHELLNKTISSEDWDYFISVKIIDPKLEKIRERVVEMWTENSPNMVPSSIDPTDLNQRGVAEIRKLIASIQ